MSLCPSLRTHKPPDGDRLLSSSARGYEQGAETKSPAPRWLHLGPTWASRCGPLLDQTPTLAVCSVSVISICPVGIPRAGLRQAAADHVGNGQVGEEPPPFRSVEAV